MNDDGAERDVNGGGRGMAERRVSMADLGAWLLKGNADRADLKRRFALDPRVERWCVQPGWLRREELRALRDVGRSVPRSAPASRGEPGGRGEPGPPGESGSLRWRRIRP